MSKGELINKEIINHPDHYFSAQSKSLDARISEVKLSESEEKEITKEHAKKFVRDKALGLFKVGEIVSEIINWPIRRSCPSFFLKNSSKRCGRSVGSIPGPSSSTEIMKSVA